MTQVKILHAADLHLDSGFEALSEGAAEERRKMQRLMQQKIVDAAESLGAQAIVLAGDVFESDAAAAETQEAFVKALAAAGMPVFIAPGNHDPYTASSVWARMALPENVHIFKSGTFECVELPGQGLRVWGAGFTGNFSAPLLENFSAPEKEAGRFDLMALHGDVCAGKSDYNAVTRAQIAASGMDYIALGHIHSRTGIETAGDTAYAYSGCTEGRGYDETGEMGAYLVTISDSGVAAKFVPLGGVRYEILSVDVGGRDPAEAIDAAAAGLTEKDHCRIILTGECAELPDTQALRRALSGRFAELQLRDETVLKRDVWEQTGQDTLAGLFLSKLRAIFDAAKTQPERDSIELAAYYGLKAIEDGGRK